MRDTFGRNIDYVRISVTDRCNLRCRYCMPDEGVDMQPATQMLSYEEILRVARICDQLGVRKIRLTGGEPLVRKGMVELITQLAQLPGAPELALTTNGLLLKEHAAGLKRAGLHRVNVSLDTLQPERFKTITRRDGLAQVLAGLDEAQRVGLVPLKVNMVPIRGVNHDEIAAFGRLAIKKRVDIRFIEYMPVGSGMGYRRDQCYSADQILADLQQVAALEPVQRTGPAGPARLFRFREGRGKVGIIPAVSDHFCRECNRIRLTSDGQIKTCLFSQREIDLRSLLRQGVSDEEIRRLLLDAVNCKPEKHQIDEEGFTPGGRGMSTIGG